MDNFELTTPLVVDLDGTLTSTDTLVESVLILLKRQPWRLLQMGFWLLAGRALFKERVSALVDLDVSGLPWRSDFVDWLVAQRAGGRRIVLATAAHRKIADAVSRHWSMFDDVLASSATNNLKGPQKLKAIQALLGNRFAYAGDSTADLPIWRAAESAVLVGASPRLSAKVQTITRVEAVFPSSSTGLRTWLKALRVHQWVKNLLLFVPLFTAFEGVQWHDWLLVVIAFGAFSLAASATYVLNDLWDLDSDRSHPRKRLRPFASGALSLSSGIAAALLCLSVAFALSALVSAGFSAMLVGYVVLTTLYSLVFKTYVLMDVLMLAMLYTYRVIAGSIAVAIEVTPWLFAFCVFTFFSLALVKRCAELVLLESAGRTASHGRDYRTEDLVVLWPLGIAASLCAVVVFGLYVATPATEARYANVQWLWLMAPALLYWFSRLWIKTVRGEMHDDPIVFAVRDRGSRFVVMGMVLLVAMAHWRA
ncbi:MAG: UbiA family prenyltransferase [Burkholderiales bacterium]|nr:MAG: UbiA family prenyltransferase [Burkholderiales bacterium]